MDLAKLAAPFPPDRISWRVGATNREKTQGMALAYLDARDVMARLDEACGTENWQCRYSHAGDKTCCEIAVKIGGEWVWKANGAGDTDVEGEKGAFSDAFKRAAVCWGVGRYLYDTKSPWVALEPAGNSFKIREDQYAKLRKALLNGAAEPEKVWLGPLTKTALTAALRALHADIIGASDEAELDEVLKDGKGVTDQLQRDLPAWWSGYDDHEGLEKVIDKRRAELKDQEATGMKPEPAPDLRTIPVPDAPDAKSRWTGWAKELGAKIDACRTEAEINSWLVPNRQALDRMQKEAAKTYDWLTGKINAATQRMAA